MVIRYLGEEVTLQKETASKIRTEAANRIAEGKVGCMYRRTFRVVQPKSTVDSGSGSSERLTEEAMEAAAAKLGAALFDNDEEGTIVYEAPVSICICVSCSARVHECCARKGLHLRMQIEHVDRVRPSPSFPVPCGFPTGH